MARETSTDLFIRFLRGVKPLRRFPLAARYGLTVLIVLICFGVRYALGEADPSPYLLFLPAILFASFVFDRGSGFLATFLSAALALYFFVEPRGSFAPQDVGGVISVVIFTLVGLLTAAVVEALRLVVEELAEKSEELTDSVNLLETVIEGTPDPIFVKDREGRFVRVNSVLAQVMGVPKEALIGKRDRDFLPAEQADKIESVDRVVMETRAPFLVEEHVSVAGDGARWFLSTTTFWSTPTPGSGVTDEPVAITMFLAVTLCPPTLTVCGSVKLARPLSQVTLFFLNRNSMPPVSCFTASRRWPCMASRSSSGVTLMPILARLPFLAASKYSDACSIALDGMQPTLRQVPPSVSRSSAQAVFSPSCAARIAAT